MIHTAIKFIKYDRPKSIGIIVGIVISIFLIGQQVGTLQFITKAMGALIENTNLQAGQIWVIDNATRNANVLTKIDSRLVWELRSLPGIENTYPIVVANGNLTLPDGQSSPVVLIGSDAPVFAGGPDTAKIIKGSILSLARANAVSVEYFDARTLKLPVTVGSRLEINGKMALIQLETKNVQSFGSHYMYMDIDNARFYGNFPNDKVSIISVKVKPGADVRQVVSEINHTFYGVKAWGIQDLRQSTIQQLLSTSNMGLSFGTLVVFAILTGFFIIGLTLYSAVLDRLKDYGTYKAIGASNGYVRGLILTQALIFAAIGFAIAMALLVVFKIGVAPAGLILQFSPGLVTFLLFVTLFISIGGSFFAIRKINKLEPASVFK